MHPGLLLFLDERARPDAAGPPLDWVGSSPRSSTYLTIRLGSRLLAALRSGFRRVCTGRTSRCYPGASVLVKPPKPPCGGPASIRGHATPCPDLTSRASRG